MGWLGEKISKAVSEGNPVAVAAVNAASKAATAAQEAKDGPTPPEGGYATFSTDDEPKKKGWRR